MRWVFFLSTAAVAVAAMAAVRTATPPCTIAPEPSPLLMHVERGHSLVRLGRSAPYAEPGAWKLCGDDGSRWLTRHLVFSYGASAEFRLARRRYDQDHGEPALLPSRLPITVRLARSGSVRADTTLTMNGKTLRMSLVRLDTISVESRF